MPAFCNCLLLLHAYYPNYFAGEIAAFLCLPQCNFKIALTINCKSTMPGLRITACPIGWPGLEQGNWLKKCADYKNLSLTKNLHIYDLLIEN